MTREVIKEGSAFATRVKFWGIGDTASTPASVRYRVKDVTNDRVVIDWMDLTPAHEIDIEVAAEYNGIYLDGQRPFQRFETRVIVVQANYDMSTRAVDEIEYKIKNLRGFDS